MRRSQQQQGSDRSQDFFPFKKADRFRFALWPELGPETSILNSAAECLEANSSKVPIAVRTSSRSKKRTGLGSHSGSELGPETSLLNSAALVMHNGSDGLNPKGRRIQPPHPKLRSARGASSV